MKSVEPSTRTSKRSRGEALTTTLTYGAMLVVEEMFVDPTAAVDPSGGAEDVDPTIAPPLSLCAMMQTFMTTQAAYRQILDELLTEVASLRANFAEYRSAFPPPPPFEN